MDNNTMNRRSQLWKGVLAAMPLSIAVIPWGILAGSYAIDAGLNQLQAQAMSAILFAGSAQLVAAGMFKSGIGLGTMLLTTFFITSRHFLYSVSMRDKISHLPARWRLLLGFWLTDELFAICSGQSQQEFNRWYAAGVGGGFYLVWNIASFVGIVAGSQIPSLNEIGLDFAVAATFIALVFPLIRTWPVVVCVVVSLIASVALSVNNVEGGLMIAAISGMLAGFISESFVERRNGNKLIKEGESA
ncbi:AzlC family ABC transporter permease [Vibrio splendidus]|jgi:4-azaleucine resistance transporter AzlC|uniref:AzlC family ABC transporter permease n=1 Tax=Vibrio splendidus TaxID=29497 RepID=A0AA43K099_VIBSP|nr:MULTISPECIES: AzlC family ABC transporter permease [Vibrio]MBB1461977.1 AzlC family ABC transporter permease [Vibrio sp. SG41-7]MCC4788777.1 AzlC family ABC transporter permease [Vibrio splendidus]MDH5923523.1 AzlC family ABC transporter permease [Vibrio splendidus]MDH5976304.1 AzlC family ABC transporter permease [Vibrio splendidus]OEE56012.1 branched-chain amino acid ABC transporter permease [Vibrio splendidus FF-500]